MIAQLRAISRMASWPCAVLVGLWVAWAQLPLTSERLLARTEGLQISYADVYSELHEQPFGWCDSYYAQRTDALGVVRAQAGQRQRTGWSAVVTTVRDYDAALSAHYEEDCRVPWHTYQNPANLQKVFTTDYPLYFLVSELRLTEIRLALMQIVAGWLGVVALALLSVYFWRSPLAPVAALYATSYLGSQSFVRTALSTLGGLGTVRTIRPDFLFPAMTILLILGWLQLVLKPRGARAAAWVIGLAVVYLAHTLLYYAIDPPVAKMFALLGLSYVVIVATVYRRWPIAAAATATAIAQLALDRLLQRPGLEIYSAVTMVNHLASEAYTNVMVYMGFFERPTPFGLFYMDEIFGWIIDQDPVLVRAAPFMAVHHSYAYVGNAMVWTAMTREPLMIVDAVFRRLLVQVFHRQLWAFWTLEIDWVYTSTLSAIVAINLWAWRRRALFLALTPITLCLLLNQFAVNTVMTLVHTHSRWNVLGVMLMFAVAPLYGIAAIELLVSTPRRRWPNWRATMRPPVAATLIVALIAAGWLAQRARRTLEQERQYVRVWMTLHKPPAAGVDIAAIVSSLESIRMQTGDARGEIAMWIVSVLRFYEGRSALPPEQRAALDRTRQHYYQVAVAAAPDNPHYLFAAWFLQIDGWESYLLRGLERFPDAVYAPGAAAALHYYGKGLPDATRESIARRYETLAGQFLSTAARRVPGFLDIPAVVQTAKGSVTEKLTSAHDGRAGRVLTMAPGAVALLSDVPTHDSAGVRMFAYLDVQQGDLEGALAFGGNGAERAFAATSVRAISKASQRVDSRYQFFEATAVDHPATFGMWLRAGASGATVEVRDYYPIADTPSHYYRSGLMERVRGRAARAGHSR